MKVQLGNADAAMAEPLDLRIEKVAPRARVTLTLSLVDDNGEEWRSEGRFETTSTGTLDLAQDASIAGTYVGVDAAGLLWSAMPEEGPDRPRAVLDRKVRGGLAPLRGPLADFGYRLSVDVAGEPRTTHKVIRRRLPGGVEPVPLPSPLAGTLFVPGEPNGAGILVIGGSEGGLFPARAAQLAGAGFTTIALAYFDYPGRPRAARGIAIEYFGEALSFLRSRPGVRGTAVIGVSRGSEAAQLLAIARPEMVDALLCWVPTHLVHRGFDMASGADFVDEQVAMWTLAGRDVPGIGHLPEDRAANLLLKGDFTTLSGRRYRESYQRAWAAIDAGAMRIPIERYRGPVLAVAGRADALWPADLGARGIVAASPHPASAALLFDNAGHLIGTPNEPRPFPFLMHWAGGYMGLESGFCAYGGTREGAAIAARTSWRASLDFVRAHCL